MKAIAKRLRRLEDEFGPADGKPRDRFRLVVRSAGEMLGSESATSRRTLCPDGTLMELVEIRNTAPRRHPGEGGRSTTMISKNLARRLERLEDSLPPALEEPLVIRIISVSPDGEPVDSGIEFKVPAVPKPFKKRRW